MKKDINIKKAFVGGVIVLDALILDEKTEKANITNRYTPLKEF